MEFRKRYKTEIIQGRHIRRYSDPLLNYDCLVRIFKFLPIADTIRLERVSKLWYAASHASWYSFRKLNFNKKLWGVFNNFNVTAEVLKKVLYRCGDYITYLDINSFPWLFSCKLEHESLGVLELLTMCQNLTTVNVTSIVMTQTDFIILAKHCKHVKKLAFGATTKGVNDSFIADFIFTKYKKLQSLKVKSNRFFRGTCFANISPGYIEELILEKCYHLDMKELPNSVGKLFNLRKLSLRQTIHKRYRNLNFEWMGNLDLEELDISHNSRSIDDQCLVTLAMACPNLKSVDLTGNYNVTDHGIIFITSLFNLEYLDISSLLRIRDRALIEMPNLEMFCCSNCENLTDEGLIRLLLTSEKLEYLICESGPTISDRFVEAAIHVVKTRTNDIPLKIYARGAKIKCKIPTNLTSLEIVT